MLDNNNSFVFMSRHVNMQHGLNAIVVEPLSAFEVCNIAAEIAHKMLDTQSNK